MQIVIDIPEENYNNLKRKDKFDDMFLNYYEKLIVHSTPLPKGHGRLIDADALIEQLKKSRCTGCDNYNGVRCRACQYDDEMADIDDAPTIIESNKGSEVDE